MDIGIAGRRALVCGASKGLGRACATSLAREGALVTIIARGKAALEAAADDIRRETGAAVTIALGDVTTDSGRAAALAACPDPDIVITNAGGPPVGDFRDWDRAEWIAALEANMLAPILLIKATIDGMIGRGYGRILNITSSAVKAPLAGLGLSNGARAGLTGFVSGLARDCARHNVTINNLLPGFVETARLRSYITALAAVDGIAPEAARARIVAGIPAGRLGVPAAFGDLCAFLCSPQAGYITAQNVLYDGGAYPGTL